MRHKIQRMLDQEINPSVASHGGKIEVVDYMNDTVFVKMTGGCQGCSSSKATLQGGVEAAIFRNFPKIKEVMDVTDHDAGENPYYLG
jgi:Fe/S biogenesis protein NfuA